MTNSRARVTFKSEMFRWTQDKKHKTAGNFFFVDLFDSKVTRQKTYINQQSKIIRGVAFGKVADQLFKTMDLNSVYTIEGGQVGNFLEISISYVVGCSC